MASSAQWLTFTKPFCGIALDNMNYSKFQNRNIPEYYNWMHLDGYTPQEILYACHKKMLKDYDDRMAAGEEAEIGEVKITSEVKVK